MADLLNLAERCEKAEGPDRDLDADIHEALFGIKTGKDLGFVEREWDRRWFCDPDGSNVCRALPLRFTSEVTDAEYALPGPEWPEYQITRRFCTGYHANVGTSDDGVGVENAAIALCAAALRARAVS